MLDDFWDTYDEFREHVNFHNEIKLSHGVSPLSIEESKKILIIGPSLDGVDASTYLVDTCCRGLVHGS